MEMAVVKQSRDNPYAIILWQLKGLLISAFILVLDPYLMLLLALRGIYKPQRNNYWSRILEEIYSVFTLSP